MLEFVLFPGIQYGQLTAKRKLFLSPGWGSSPLPFISLYVTWGKLLNPTKS
jgi:hypothetical protein